VGVSLTNLVCGFKRVGCFTFFFMGDHDDDDHDDDVANFYKICVF
jgi:hypothetical protein